MLRYNHSSNKPIMKLLFAFLLCLTTCFAVQAQHKKKHERYVATKGYKVEYDTAVVVSRAAYREDIRILKRKDFIIDSLQSSLDSLYAERNQQTIMANRQQEEAKSHMEAGIPQSRVSRKNKWYMNPIFGLGAGLLIGIYLIPDNTL